MQILGFTFDKLLLIFLLAAFLIGPKQLPVYARKLGLLLAKLKQVGEEAKQQLSKEAAELVEVTEKATELMKTNRLTQGLVSTAASQPLSAQVTKPASGPIDDEAT